MISEQKYLQDLANIRSMMERSSKFLSLSGWAGIMAGIYALAGALIAWQYYSFYPEAETVELSGSRNGVITLAIVVLILSVGTAIFLSIRKANTKGEYAWNATSRRLLVQMTVPLSAGGLLMLILWSKGLTGLMAPLSLLFYGIALYNASKFTYIEVKYLGLIQIVLGLISSWLIGYSLLFWATGFGVFHIIYGIYMYFKYER